MPAQVQLERGSPLARCLPASLPQTDPDHISLALISANLAKPYGGRQARQVIACQSADNRRQIQEEGDR